jgi:histone H3/H4
MEIYIITKNVYGNDLFYVKDKFAAKVVSQLTGRKTVTRYDIDNLSLLGVKVRVSEEAQEALGWTAEEAGTKAVNEADMEAWRKRCQI